MLMKHLLVISSLLILTIYLVSCKSGKLTTYNGRYVAITKNFGCKVILSAQDSTFQIQFQGLTTLKGDGKWKQEGDTIYLQCQSVNSPVNLLEGGRIYDQTFKILVKGKSFYYNNVPLKKMMNNGHRDKRNKL